MRRVIISCSLLAMVLSSCNSNNTSRQKTEISIPVSIEEISNKQLEKFSTTTGSVNPMAVAEVVNEVAGDYIPMKNTKTNQPYKIGDMVKKGEVIAKLQDEEFVNENSIETKKIRLDIAKGELEKYIALEKKGGATLTDIRNAEVAVTTAETTYKSAELALEKMNIVSPISGVIVDMEYFTPNVEISNGKTIFKVMDYSKLLLNIALSESTMDHVKVGQSVYITHYSLPRDTIYAKINQLSPLIDSETRTYKGVVSIDNKKLKLKPGMFVKSDIVVDDVKAGVIIPKTAIRDRGNAKIVFIADGTTAKERRIVTGIENRDMIQVVKGLNKGDKLIIDGHETLRDNSKIKILK